MQLVRKFLDIFPQRKKEKHVSADHFQLSIVSAVQFQCLLDDHLHTKIWSKFRFGI